MKITKETLYSEVYMFVTKEQYDKVKELVSTEDLQGYDTLLGASLGDFIRITKQDEETIKKIFFIDKNFTFWEFCKRLKWLEIEIKKIQNIFDSMKTNQTKEQKQAMQGVNFLPFELEILCYTQEAFFYNSLLDAEGHRLSEVLTKKRREAANAQYEKNLRNIYDKK